MKQSILIDAWPNHGVQPDVAQRVIAYWTAVHPDLGAGVARGLGLREAAVAPAGD